VAKLARQGTLDP